MAVQKNERFAHISTCVHIHTHIHTDTCTNTCACTLGWLKGDRSVGNRGTCNHFLESSNPRCSKQENGFGGSLNFPDWMHSPIWYGGSHIQGSQTLMSRFSIFIILQPLQKCFGWINYSSCAKIFLPAGIWPQNNRNFVLPYFLTVPYSAAKRKWLLLKLFHLQILVKMTFFISKSDVLDIYQKQNNKVLAPGQQALLIHERNM